MFNKKNTYKELKKIIKQGQILVDEPLKNHTTFKVGGVADFIITPKTVFEVVALVNYINQQKINYYVLGNGSNVLASDNGFKGIIIKMTELKEITPLNNGYLQVLAGASLQSVVDYATENNLQGMEEGAGIPGTVGGAIIMNANAYGYETKDVVLGVLAIIDGKITYLTNEQCEFVYRNSVFHKHPDAIILRVDFKLKLDENTDLVAIKNEIMAKRAFNQPLDYPNAGSIFKRVDGIIVSKMIDETGLKGFGNEFAEVSKKHAGFIINKGNAKAKDVAMVINGVKDKIKAEHNIDLEEEIRYLGEF